MTRSSELKLQTLDSNLLSAGARVRARVLALLHGALRESGIDKTVLANRMGVRKSAVSSIFRGNGNLRMDTLAECLAALGFEADLTVVRYGEIDTARDERRSPKSICVTLADRDRTNGNDWVLAIQPTTPWFMLATSDSHRTEPHRPELHRAYVQQLVSANQ